MRQDAHLIWLTSSKRKFEQIFYCGQKRSHRVTFKFLARIHVVIELYHSNDTHAEAKIFI